MKTCKDCINYNTWTSTCKIVDKKMNPLYIAGGCKLFKQTDKPELALK